MAHSHESNIKRIWIVFGLLSVITIVEVILGIQKPAFLHETNLIPDEFIELDIHNPYNCKSILHYVGIHAP